MKLFQEVDGLSKKSTVNVLLVMLYVLSMVKFEVPQTYIAIFYFYTARRKCHEWKHQTVTGQPAVCVCV